MSYPYPPNPYRPQGPPPMGASEDESSLRTLSILHYIYGAMVSLAAGIGVLYMGLGIFMATSGTAAESAAAGTAIAAVGAVIVVLVGASAALHLYAGYCLGKRKHHTLCLVAACMSLLAVPLGTVLGIFTLIVLTKPHVKQWFS